MNELDASIAEVTVYADRALVTRRGTIHLDSGEHEIRVNNLPEFQRESLRVSGQGPENTRILDIDIRTAFYSRATDDEILTLQTELELLQQQQQLLAARQDALNDRRKWLRALGEQSRDFARGLAQGQMKPQDCADFFTFASQQALEDAKAAQDLEALMRQVEQDIAAKQRELAQKQGYTHPDRLSALVIVELPQSADITFDLSYIVMNASWYPQYDVRVQMNDEGSSGEVDLSYVGMVQQATGERWENVALSLSTARPSLAAILPELEPWYLHVYIPPPPIVPMAAAAPAMHSRALMKQAASGEANTYGSSASQADMASMRMPAMISTTTVEQTGTAYVFHAGRSVDIPSDNSPHKTAISHDAIPCELDYVCAPAIEENAHQRATITNTTERVFLPGEAHIFLGGAYVGTTQVKMTAPNEKFKIFLGIDDSIKIKRELIENTVDKGILLQNDLRRITYGYRITVHNYSAYPRKIVLRDHLPIPQHERIKIKAQSIQPAPTERTKMEIMTWRFTLPADDKYTIEYRFLVEHPRDLQVIGLPPT